MLNSSRLVGVATRVVGWVLASADVGSATGQMLPRVKGGFPEVQLKASLSRRRTLSCQHLSFNYRGGYLKWDLVNY